MDGVSAAFRNARFCQVLVESVASLDKNISALRKMQIAVHAKSKAKRKGKVSPLRKSKMQKIGKLLHYGGGLTCPF